MRTSAPVAKLAQPYELATDVTTLRLAVEQLNAQAKDLAQRYPKNSGLAESVMFLQKALMCISDEDEIGLDPAIQVNWQAFGNTLRLRRIQANLGQKEVADLLDLSESMVRAIEGATKRPSRPTLLRLLALPQLGMHLDDVLGNSHSDGIIPTLWLAPRYDPYKLLTKLVEQLNGSGGSLEQTTAYLDYQSAADWLATCNTPGHLAAFSNNDALEAVAKQIAEQCGAGGVDVIALGCGDARREVELTKCLVEYTKRRSIKDVRLFLVDISHMLLTEGHNYAVTKLGSTVKKIVALHGNFHDISQYPLFSPGDLRSRCRVFTLLGCTMAHLDNEVRFFRDTMTAAAPGDFFIADYTNAYAPPEQPERIRELDPPLQTGLLATHKTWLGGLIKRYTKGVRAVDLRLELNTDCNVRGSYELVYVANVTMTKADPSRRFVVWRVRRYDPTLLEDCLSRTGWTTEQRIPYGGNDRQQLTLTLLRRAPQLPPR